MKVRGRERERFEEKTAISIIFVLFVQVHVCVVRQ